MPASYNIVLVVQDRGLRGALTARLSIAGVSVTTATTISAATLRRAVAHDIALIVDDDMVAHQPAGWVARMADEGRWSGIVILAPDSWPRHDLGSGVSVIDKGDPTAAILDQLARWRGERAAALKAAETSPPQTRSEAPRTGCAH